MKLLLFKISGDGDYGALSFEQSETSVKDCYDQMIEKSIDVIQDEYEDWEISLQKEISVRDKEEADKIVGALNLVCAEDWIGDYDSLKNTNWTYLVIND